MLGSIRKTIAFLREKQIFHKLGLLMSLTIIASPATSSITCCASWISAS